MSARNADAPDGILRMILATKGGTMENYTPTLKTKIVGWFKNLVWRVRFHFAPVKSMPTNVDGGRMLYKEIDGGLYCIEVLP